MKPPPPPPPSVMMTTMMKNEKYSKMVDEDGQSISTDDKNEKSIITIDNIILIHRIKSSLKIFLILWYIIFFISFIIVFKSVPDWYSLFNNNTNLLGFSAFIISLTAFIISLITLSNMFVIIIIGVIVEKCI